MFIPDPDFLPITDPGSRIQKPQQKRGEKKICCRTLFCSHKFHKIENYFISEMLKKKFGPVFKESNNFLPKNLSLSSKKYGFGDPGSGIKIFRIPDPGPGDKKVPDPGFGSATPAVRIIPDPELFTDKVFPGYGAQINVEHINRTFKSSNNVLKK
jgi:hypothetical protein